MKVSNKAIYPTFARTLPPSSKVSKSLITTLLHFNWKKVSMLWEDFKLWLDFFPLSSSRTHLRSKVLNERMSESWKYQSIDRLLKWWSFFTWLISLSWFINFFISHVTPCVSLDDMAWHALDTHRSFWLQSIRQPTIDRSKKPLSMISRSFSRRHHSWVRSQLPQHRHPYLSSPLLTAWHRDHHRPPGPSILRWLKSPKLTTLRAIMSEETSISWGPSLINQRIRREVSKRNSYFTSLTELSPNSVPYQTFNYFCHFH